MEAGASHPMPRRRHLSRALVVLVSMAGWAVVPAAAAALGTVESTVATVESAVQPAVDAVTAPAPEGGGDPVEQTVAPVADAAGASVPPAAAAVPQAHLDEHAQTRVARIAAGSSVERVSSGRAVHTQSSQGGARQRPSAERNAPARGTGRQVTGVAKGSENAAATPSPPTAEPGSGFSTDAAASGAATSFLFGGAFALLVATLLLAGPRLRRQLSLSPAVCRPAAFLVVLERPG
jgi:hypothetical protein